MKKIVGSLNREHLSVLYGFYETYNDVIKLLIADIEASSEHFPQNVLNETRAFNDHIARCYKSGLSEKQVQEQLDMAGRHVKRITFDCFKYLNVIYFERIEKFERQFRRVDLTTINNGEFFKKYHELSRLTRKYKKNAKKLESGDWSLSFLEYEKAYNTYCELDQLIDENIKHAHWARIHFYSKRIGWGLAGIGAMILSGFIGNYIRVLFFQEHKKVAVIDWIRSIFL